QHGDGFGPLRGFRRLGVRVFGSDVTPPTRVWGRALNYEVTRMSRAVGSPHRDAAIVLRGLRPTVVAGRTGRGLDREGASAAIVQALAAFERGGPVPRRARPAPPSVSATDLTPVLAQVRTALSGRIRMTLGGSSWWLWPGQLARLLALPHDGASSLGIGGPAADRYFPRLGRGLCRPPPDATLRGLASGSVVLGPPPPRPRVHPPPPPPPPP